MTDDITTEFEAMALLKIHKRTRQGAGVLRWVTRELDGRKVAPEVILSLVAKGLIEPAGSTTQYRLMEPKS